MARPLREACRPTLKPLFQGRLTKAKLDALILGTIHRYGYSQREGADWLDLHYGTVIRLANRP